MRKYIIKGQTFYTGKGYSLTPVPVEFSDHSGWYVGGAELRYYGAIVASWSIHKFDDEVSAMDEIYKSLKGVK